MLRLTKLRECVCVLKSDRHVNFRIKRCIYYSKEKKKKKDISVVLLCCTIDDIEECVLYTVSGYEITGVCVC